MKTQYSASPRLLRSGPNLANHDRLDLPCAVSPHFMMHMVPCSTSIGAHMLSASTHVKCEQAKKQPKKTEDSDSNLNKVS